YKQKKNNFNLLPKKKKKDNSKEYRYTECKTLNKCKIFILLKDKKEILKYENLHNNLEKEFDASISIVKHKIKDEIKKSSITLEMGYICPEYHTIKFQIIRDITSELFNHILSPSLKFGASD
ncbi:hypothetical protein H8356DRAFT_933677, partial [Neocallimastix lanati (nom. inval.)]